MFDLVILFAMVAACATALSERKQAIMLEDELIAELNNARQLAQRFNLDFQEILDHTLRTFPFCKSYLR